MAHERLADLRAGTGDGVDNARWQPRLHEDLGQAQRRERRRVGRLGDECVAAQQARPELVAQQRRREVPRHDRGHHAQWAAQHAALDAGIESLDGNAADLAAHAGVVLERLGGLAQLDARLADRLTLLGDEDRHELVDVRRERLGAGVQNLAALGVAERRPGVERPVGRPHRLVDRRRVGPRGVADDLAGPRVDDLKRGVRQRLGLAGDEQPALQRRCGRRAHLRPPRSAERASR
jgi:hypothetical protein